MKSWIEISQQALTHNYRSLVAAASPSGTTPVLAVIKANAYGHSLPLCAPILAAAGAPWFGVTDAHEGQLARRALAYLPPAAQPRILIMSGLLPDPSEADAILQHDLTATVWTPLHLDCLSAAASRAGRPATVHLEIDTGMSRQGALPGPDLTHLLNLLAATPNLRLGGLFTHFASSEVADSPQTPLQQQRFEAAVEQLRAHTVFSAQKSISCPLFLHASNTSALDLGATPDWLNHLAFSIGAQPLARAGLALYGCALPLPLPHKLHTLKPVLTWKTRILDLRDATPTTTIGYNGTFTTTHPTRLALLPVGYADGLRRELSSTSTHPSGWVIVQAQRAPILGRISMNLSTIDVSTLQPLHPGDEVTLLGPGISAGAHASLARTIPYEILCGIRATPRLVD